MGKKIKKKVSSRKKAVAVKKVAKKKVGSGQKAVAVKKKNGSRQKAVAVKKAVKKKSAKPFAPHRTALKEGMVSQYFEGVDQNNQLIRSSDLIGKTIILYFYPKDDTPGCTAESCSLRDEYKYLSNSNFVVIGVSSDDVKSHKKFADKYELPFSLIADTKKEIISAFDVWGKKQLAGRIYDGIVRTTFIIDPDGVIRNIISKVDTENHAQQVLSL